MRFFAALFLVLLSGAGVEAQQAKPNPAFQPTWESIRTHKVPAWFDDAKFGIFVHWGLYSVPAWATPSGELGTVDPRVWFRDNAYAEWYLNTLRIDGSPTQKHHYATYGKNFSYLDFIPEFNQSVAKWDPDAMAGLFSEIGANYVVLTTKHHDGFTLWPSRVPNPKRSAAQQQAARDIVGELSKAVRSKGMRMGFYYSGGLDWSFNTKPVLTGKDVTGTIIHTQAFARYADAHWRELIERYQPSVLWNDIGYPKQGDLVHIISDFYNRNPEGLINNRFETGLVNAPRRHHDFVTPEYQKLDKIADYKWESCRGLGYSFGYNQVEGAKQTIPEKELIHLLIDIVSKNGNLLLNVGPKADGSIPEIQVQRLRALGQWLKVNGEAIYKTRPWTRSNGKTSDGLDVRFTRNGETIYAILLGKPKRPTVTVESLPVPAGARISLLGGPAQLERQQNSGKLIVTLPANLPESHAYVLKIVPGA